MSPLDRLRRLPGPVTAISTRYGAKLGLAFLAVIAVVAASGAVVHVQTDEQVRTDAREDLTSISSVRAAELDVWLSSVSREARLTSAHPTLASRDREAIRGHLSGLVREEAVPEGVVAVHYLDTREMRILTSSADGMIGVSPREQGAAFAEDPPSFEGPDDVHVSAPFRVPAVDFPVVAVISPVPGQPDRAVVYMINLERRVESITGTGGGAFTTVVDGSGRYVAHPDRERLLGEFDADGSGAMATARSGGVGYSTVGETAAAYVPLETTDWVVVTHDPKSHAYALAERVTAHVVALTLLAVVSLAIVGVAVGTTTLPVLRRLARKADRIGAGDLDVDFESDRRDEFGTLVDSFAEMRDSLAATIAEAEAARETAEDRREAAEARTERLEATAAHYEAVMVDCAAGDLTRRVDPESDSDAMGAIGEAFNEMMAALEGTLAEVTGFAAHVADATDDVAAATGTVTDASQQVDAAVADIAEGAHRQAETVTAVADEMSALSASAEEIASTVEEATETTGEAAAEGEAGRAAAERAIEEMDAVERETDRTVEAIERLEAEMAAVGEVADLIADIADQTNLLALNASIEAARSGHDGEGFAVVADEVKELAEEARAAAGDIDERIGRIQEQTAETAADMRSTSERVEAGVETVEEAVESLSHIAELADAIDASVREISDATDDQAGSAQAVVGMIDEVEAISHRTRESADDVAAATDDQAETLEAVGENVAALAGRAESLVEVLSEFEVGADGVEAESGTAGVAADD